jgi:hypothetical protein
VLKPTAQTSSADTALMPVSTPGTENRQRFQAPPSECSIPLVVTAHASVGETAATPVSPAPRVGAFGVGLGTVDHKVPHFAV